MISAQKGYKNTRVATQSTSKNCSHLCKLYSSSAITLRDAVNVTGVINHASLKHFFSQNTLSRRQALWLDRFCHFQRHLDSVKKIGRRHHAYALSGSSDIKDALQNYISEPEEPHLDTATTTEISPLLLQIKHGCSQDPFHSQKRVSCWLRLSDNGIYRAFGDRIAVPALPDWRRTILFELHDAS